MEKEQRGMKNEELRMENGEWNAAINNPQALNRAFDSPFSILHFPFSIQAFPLTPPTPKPAASSPS